ncbi:MAG: DAK2 domain-containing protein [Chloroflexi bacterium]|nr:DAK2 domain-containing protein [Chloroflexota bacterium]
MTSHSIGGRALKRFFRAGLNNLSRNVDLINRLNVFPVPDGDTGINMFHTLQRAYREIEDTESDDFSLIAGGFARGALMGARGNSGTILSQLLQGFADGLDNAPLLSDELFARACKAAVQRGYASVSEPKEGTILTVAREATETLQQRKSGSSSLMEMLETLIAAADASLNNTPQLLPILQDAGVVDAGGMGLVCFLRGLRGDRSPLQARSAQNAGNLAAAGAGTESFGYDVQFLMIGKNLDLTQTRRDLEQLGWSVIVVGDEKTMKVHIHVDNPAGPLDYAIRSGAALDDVVVENMTLQHQQSLVGASSMRVQPDAASLNAWVVAVAEGDGLRAVFNDLKCGAVIRGGAGYNPSAEDFIAAIQQATVDHVIILPNNPNVILAARQAADLVEPMLARVVPTETVLQGINAMLALGDATDADADFESTIAQMSAACEEIHSIEIARASRGTRIGDLEISENDIIAIVDGAIRSASSDVARATLDAFAVLDVASLELATVYYGAGISELETNQLIRRLTKSIEGLEFEAIYGGQSLYPFLISVE